MQHSKTWGGGIQPPLLPVLLGLRLKFNRILSGFITIITCLQNYLQQLTHSQTHYLYSPPKRFKVASPHTNDLLEYGKGEGNCSVVSNKTAKILSGWNQIAQRCWSNFLLISASSIENTRRQRCWTNIVEQFTPNLTLCWGECINYINLYNFHTK